MRLRALVIAATLMAYAAPAMAQGVEVRGRGKIKGTIQVGTVSEAKVTGYSPTSGPVGTTVTVTGSNFTQRTRIKVGGRPVRLDSFNATSLTFRIPERFYDGVITLHQPGMGNEIPVGSFQVQVDPRISSYNPRSGPVGTRVELNGAGFVNGDQILFNGKPLPVAEFGPNRVVVVIPQGATTDEFTVVRPSTRYSWGSKMRFDVSLPAPTVSAIAPTQGPPGTQVRITGAYFAPDDRVYYGPQRQPANVVARADNWIDVQVPPNARQSNPFTIRGSRGNVQTPVFVLVVNPSIARFQPEYGPSGTQVDIYGSSFAQGDQVYFNGKPVRRIGYDEQKLSVEIPPGATSDRFVIWRNGQAIATSANMFEVLNAPTIAGFAPTQGASGTRVQLSGRGFGPDARVTYGAQPLRIVGRRGDDQIDVIIPRGAQSQPFTVTTRGGSVNSATAFQVIQYSGILSISPDRGPVGTRVTISQDNYSGSDNFWLGGVPLPVVDRAPGRYVVQIPANATTGRIEWESYGRRETSNHTFTVVREVSITRFEPASGLPNTKVTVYGTEFTGSSQVLFGNTGWPVVKRSPTEITFVVPREAGPGRDFIYVRDAGKLTKSPVQFEVLPLPLPTFSPQSGPPGTHVTVSNVQVTPQTVVRFDNKNATIVRRAGTNLEFVIPDGPGGVDTIQIVNGKDVEVLKPGFQRIGAPKPTPAPAPPPPPPPAPTPAPAACTLSVSPASAVPGQTVTVDLRNCNMSDVKQAWFNGESTPIVSKNANQVVVRLPPKATGTDYITVETQIGTAGVERKRTSNKVTIKSGY